MNHTMHGIIFSYGKPTGLGDLIAHRIPGSMPFGGNYRVVDFMLSSMVNAGIHDVGVIMHGKCQSMLDHLGNGRSWDLSRNRGGLTLLPAFAYAESRTSAGRFRGKVEALGCVLEYLREIRQEYVVLADSDLVINLPLEQVLQEHIASGADLTEVCTAEPGNPSDTYLELDEQGRIVDVAYDVHTPAGYRCLNVCILRRELLVQLVEECMAHNRYSFRHHIYRIRRIGCICTPMCGRGMPPASIRYRPTTAAAWSCWTRRSGGCCSIPGDPFWPRRTMRLRRIWTLPGCARTPSLPMAAIFRAA